MMWLAAIVIVALVATDAVPPFFAGVLVCGFVQRLRAHANKEPPPPTPLKTALVSVIGNIASGKSRAIKYYQLQAPKDTVCVLEPVEEWGPLLKSMEFDSNAWVDLQMLAASFYATLKAPDAAKVMIQERDLMSVALFAGHRKGIATLLVALVQSAKIALPDVVVHVRTSWEACFERIEAQTRDQAGDAYAAGKGAEYFAALDVRHNQLLKWYSSHGCPIINIESNNNTAALGLDAAREEALVVREQFPSGRFVTADMMTELLQMLWPPPSDDLKLD